MAILENYNAFGGRWWDSGSIRNALAAQGVVAPHTGEPLSEALLFGVVGGITFGYFNFTYEGEDAQCNILTRNTFQMFDPILDRLGIPCEVYHTNKPDKAVQNLVEAIEGNFAPIVWADHWLLPYNGYPEDTSIWGMMPIVVYGYDEANDAVHLADRAYVPLQITIEELAITRARVKKDKHRVMTLGAPNFDKLPTAVKQGIWDCIKLFTEKPPKGSAKNFGFRAYQHWYDMLVKPKQKQSWAKVFNPPANLYTGLTTAYHFALQFGEDETKQADRNLFAQFLDESAVILDNQALCDVAAIFRKAGEEWVTLCNCLLPDNVAILREARDLLDKKHNLFLHQGHKALDDIKAINQRLQEIRDSMDNGFPLDEAGIQQLQENIADQVMVIHDIEHEGINALTDAMS